MSILCCNPDGSTEAPVRFASSLEKGKQNYNYVMNTCALTSFVKCTRLRDVGFRMGAYLTTKREEVEKLKTRQWRTLAERKKDGRQAEAIGKEKTEERKKTENDVSKANEQEAEAIGKEKTEEKKKSEYDVSKANEQEAEAI